MFQNIEADDQSSIDKKEQDEIAEISEYIRQDVLLADDDSNDKSVVITEPDFDELYIDPEYTILKLIFESTMLGLDILDDVQIKGTVIDNTFIFTHDLDAIEIDKIKDRMISIEKVRDNTPDEIIEMLEKWGDSL